MHDAVLNPTLCIPLHRGAERFERMVYIELAFNAEEQRLVTQHLPPVLRRSPIRGSFAS
jgi:hypothetical protein